MGVDPATRGLIYGIGSIVLLLIIFMGGYWLKSMDERSRASLQQDPEEEK